MDAALFRQINRLAASTPWLHWSLIAFARYGIAAFALALVAGWWIARRSGDLVGQAGVVWAGLASLAALGLGQVIGGAVDRARPYTAMPGAHVLISRTTDFSFPSDHATIAGAVAAGLYLAMPGHRRDRLVQLTMVAAAIMALSRVYVGVHYPTDVIAGLALGAIVATALRPAALRIVLPCVEAIARTPVGALLAVEPPVGGGVQSRPSVRLRRR